MSGFAGFCNAVLASGLLWGTAATVAAHRLVAVGICPLPAAERYWSAHWTHLATTLLLAIGMAALTIKTIHLLRQWKSLHSETLDPPVAGGQSIDVCPELLRQLPCPPHAACQTYLTGRLREALMFVQRRGSAEQLDGELRSLAARDRRRMIASYALPWLMLALLPLASGSGWLALASRDGAAASEALQWGLAFWATLLAINAAVLRCEWLLLERVDDGVARQLLGRFLRLSAGNDPQVLAVRRMADAVVQVTERLVHRQVELWQSTIETAQARWNETAKASSELQASPDDGDVQQPNVVAFATAARRRVHPLPDRAENRAA